MEIIDISQPVFGCSVYKGDTVPSKKTVENKAEGYIVTDVNFCLHNGTHIDAPSHFIAGANCVEKVSLATCMGQCALFRTNGVVDKTKAESFRGLSRVLIDGASLDVSGAETLVKNGVKLVGVSANSVAAESSGEKAVHSVLLRNDVVVLEGLKLNEAEEGIYILIAFPVNFNGCEAAPTRAVLIKQ